MNLFNIIIGLIIIVALILAVIFIPPKIWYLIIAGGLFVGWLVFLAIKVKNEV